MGRAVPEPGSLDPALAPLMRLGKLPVSGRVPPRRAVPRSPAL